MTLYLDSAHRSPEDPHAPRETVTMPRWVFELLTHQTPPCPRCMDTHAAGLLRYCAYCGRRLPERGH